MSRWTKDNTAKAIKLFTAGETLREIANALGDGFSRNAVLGKLARAGLIGNRRNGHAARPVRTDRSISKPLPKEAEALDGVAVVRLEDLGNDDCKYPIGDPQAPAFGFCGAPKADGRPYCQPHCAIAYTPQSAAKRKSATFAYVERK